MKTYSSHLAKQEISKLIHPKRNQGLHVYSSDQGVQESTAEFSFSKVHALCNHKRRNKLILFSQLKTTSQWSIFH